MRKNIVILFAATSLFATPAFAGSFSGARAEVRGGLDRTTIDLSYDDGFDSFSESGHKTGVDLGAEVGFDAPLGSTVVAGAYAGVDFATTKKCEAIFGGDKACLKLGRNLTAGVRVGAKVTPLVMLYAKGGYSNGQVKASYSNNADPSLNGSDHANRDGFHFGVGAEMLVGKQGYVRAEYVRTNYDDYDYADSDFGVNVDAHRDQLLVGFGLRF